MSTQSTNQSTALYLFAALSGVLVLAGISTKNDYLFGAGIVSIVAAILATLALKLRESAAQAVERQRGQARAEKLGVQFVPADDEQSA